MPKCMNELQLHWFENNKKHFGILSLYLFAFWFSRSACTRKSVCWISRLPSWKYTQRNIYIIDRLANCLIGIIAKKGHCSDHTSSKSVAIIYLHKETSFVFDETSFLVSTKLVYLFLITVSTVFVWLYLRFPPCFVWLYLRFPPC